MTQSCDILPPPPPLWDGLLPPPPPDSGDVPLGGVGHEPSATRKPYTSEEAALPSPLNTAIPEYISVPPPPPEKQEKPRIPEVLLVAAGGESPDIVVNLVALSPQHSLVYKPKQNKEQSDHNAGQLHHNAYLQAGKEQREDNLLPPSSNSNLRDSGRGSTGGKFVVRTPVTPNGILEVPTKPVVQPQAQISPTAPELPVLPARGSGAFALTPQEKLPMVDQLNDAFRSPDKKSHNSTKFAAIGVLALAGFLLVGSIASSRNDNESVSHVSLDALPTERDIAQIEDLSAPPVFKDIPIRGLGAGEEQTIRQAETNVRDILAAYRSDIILAAEDPRAGWPGNLSGGTVVRLLQAELLGPNAGAGDPNNSLGPIPNTLSETFRLISEANTKGNTERQKPQVLPFNPQDLKSNLEAAALKIREVHTDWMKKNAGKPDSNFEQYFLSLLYGLDPSDPNSAQVVKNTQDAINQFSSTSDLPFENLLVDALQNNPDYFGHLETDKQNLVKMGKLPA